MKEAHDLEVVSKVPPGTDLPSPDVQGKFRKLATDVLNAVNKALGRYRELCVFIRENQLAPGYVRVELRERGYTDDVISRITKVADAPQVDFDKFAKAELSFRAALRLTRVSNVNPEVKKAVQAHRERESEKFRRELTDLLGLYIPISGGLPKYLQVTLKGEVNGYPWKLVFGRKPKGAK